MLELIFLCIFVLQKKVFIIRRSEIIEINHIETMISFKLYRAKIISALIFFSLNIRCCRINNLLSTIKYSMQLRSTDPN